MEQKIGSIFFFCFCTTVSSHFFSSVWVPHMFAVSAFLMFSSLSSPAIPHLPFLILWESILPSRLSLPTVFYDYLYAECNLYELTRS